MLLNRRRASSHGISLVELLVVLAIVMLLLGILVPTIVLLVRAVRALGMPLPHH